MNKKEKQLFDKYVKEAAKKIHLEHLKNPNVHIPEIVSYLAKGGESPLNPNPSSSS